MHVARRGIIFAAAVLFVACCVLAAGGAASGDYGPYDAAQTLSYDQSDGSAASASDETLTIGSVSYDRSTGILAVSGEASAPLVNVHVRDVGESGVIDAVLVHDGAFSGSFRIGILAPGTYTVVVSGADAVITGTFVVSDINLVVTEATYDGSTGIVSYSGTANAELVNVVVIGDGFVSQIDACIPHGGTFSGSMDVGDLSAGGYTVVASAGGVSATCPVTVGPADVPEGTVLGDDGRRLVGFTGSVSDYRLPSSVEVVSDGAFDSCSIKRFILDRDVTWEITTPDVFPFENAGVESIDISEGVTAIPSYLFAKTGVSALVIPSSVVSIGTKAFYLCSQLTEVEFEGPSELQMIGSYSFSSNAKLSSLTFGPSADGAECSIGVGAFVADNRLSSVTMTGFRLVEIGDYAFTKVYRETSVDAMFNKATGEYVCEGVRINSENGMVIPASVRSIGYAAFSFTGGLMFHPSEPQNNTVYVGLLRAIIPVIHLGEGSVLSFEDGSAISSISDRAFAGISQFSRIDLSSCSDLVTIGAEAFRYSMSSDVAVVWPQESSLQTLGDYAFYTNSRITQSTETVLPASVETVGSRALSFTSSISFAEGSALTSISSHGETFSIDLRNCHGLEYDDSDSKVKLPVAVFGTTLRMYRMINVDDTTPIAGVSDDDPSTLVIGKDTVAIVTKVFEGDAIAGIVCDPDNPYFSYADGMLVFSSPYGGSDRLIYMAGDPVVVTMKSTGSGLYVGSGVLKSTLRELVLDGAVRLAPDALPSDSGLEAVTFIDAISDASVAEAFGSFSGSIQFNLPSGSSDAIIRQLGTVGDVYIGYDGGNSHTVLVPDSYGGTRIAYADASEGGSFALKVSGLPSVAVAGVGCVAYLKDGVLTVDDLIAERCKVVLRPLDNSVIGTVSVVFDGNGGSSDGKGAVEVQVFVGSALVASQVPVFTKDLGTFSGWLLGGESFDLSSAIYKDIVLTAEWTARGPTVSIDDVAAGISIVGDSSGPVSPGEVDKGSYTFHIANVRAGYEVFRWTVNGTDSGDASKDLVLDVQSDVIVGVTYRFHSSSSGYEAVSNRGLPTPEEVVNLVKSYELGGWIDQSGYMWKGHSSVPLIVDDTVYFRAGDTLYMAESDTGFIIKSVASKEPEAYYHYLGYGDGVIIDYITNKAYDLDLNQIFVLPTSVGGNAVGITGVQFYEGYFYTSGETVYRFTATDDDPSRTGETKTLTLVGTIEGTYASYGFAKSVFVGNYLYRIVADGMERGIAALNLSTGDVSRVWIGDLRNLFLDDGWMSYHDGRLYLTAYSEGLFGSKASDENARVAYLTVNGGEFGEPSCYVFDEGGFTSEFIVVNGIGYVNCDTHLYAFDMSSGVLKDPRKVESSFGHGSMTVDITDIGSDGAPVYIYMIPYQGDRSVIGYTFCMIEDVGYGDARTMTRYTVSYLPENWNSQTVRTDADGRMIWYNDSGHVFSYTTAEKNPYFFFIGDGTNYVWYESYGRTAADALSRLGSDIITLDDGLDVATVFGESVDDASIWVLRSTASQSTITDLRKYGWTGIDSFLDSSYSTCHYYIIRSDSGSYINEGTQFRYLDDGMVTTYSFAMNIGDRTLVGAPMVLGDSVSKMSFYSGDTLISEILGVVGSTAGRSFPDVSEQGKIAQWKDSSGNVIVSLEGQRFIASGSSYYLSWVDAPTEFGVTATFTKSEGGATVDYILEGTINQIGMELDIFVLCGDGTSAVSTIGIDESSMTGHVSIPSDVLYCYLKVHLAGQSDPVVEDYGSCLVVPEVQS